MIGPETRRLDWPDLRNARDLGGLPTGGGGRIRPGALVRSDTAHRLTADGIAAARAYGIGRVVDLRSEREARDWPNPFADDPDYRLRPLIDPRRGVASPQNPEHSLARIYRASLTRNGSFIVAGIAAIADAPPGGVLVHCYVGKDRTGMTVALLLRLAGVSDDDIAADYAYSAVGLRAEFDEVLATAHDPARRTFLVEEFSSRPETILATLEQLDTEYGGIQPYLLAHGMDADTIATLRDRLVEPDESANPARPGGADTAAAGTLTW
jgi:protein tyrosine/serine phosphatase